VVQRYRKKGVLVADRSLKRGEEDDRMTGMLQTVVKKRDNEAMTGKIETPRDPTANSSGLRDSIWSMIFSNVLAELNWYCRQL
jgi:hypothetical protein